MVLWRSNQGGKSREPELPRDQIIEDDIGELGDYKISTYYFHVKNNYSGFLLFILVNMSGQNNIFPPTTRLFMEAVEVVIIQNKS